MSTALRATFIVVILAMLVGWVSLSRQNRELAREIAGTATVEVGI